jgi:hypothetical protein
MRVVNTKTGGERSGEDLLLTLLPSVLTTVGYLFIYSGPLWPESSHPKQSWFPESLGCYHPHHVVKYLDVAKVKKLGRMPPPNPQGSAPRGRETQPQLFITIVSMSNAGASKGPCGTVNITWLYMQKL